MTRPPHEPATCARGSSGSPPPSPRQKLDCELAATRKVINGLALCDHGPVSAETTTATVYQRIVTTFNEHPEKVFRVRDLHEHLVLPTDEPSINVTRSRLGRLVRQGLLEQPGCGRYQKRT
ncbi:hypothetical protein [Streptomyces alkaliphilus]|uniref:hypothetical protein n=1 Tax=Streptomyces alkaliphilus TaxID=1472722 RepID=UPI001E361CE2|nr:hypothetical protein [Streptomyces alkaliphilus]